METLKTALAMIKKNAWFASIDLRQAYYSIPVHINSRKFLKFHWNGKYYQFTCLPNGLASAPRTYTKVLKPVFSSLRKMGHVNVVYIDDSLLQGDTYADCQANIQDTLNLVDELGFTVHTEKSIVIPTQRIVFVGFQLDSVSMTVRLTLEKCNDIIECCTNILNSKTVSIRELAKVIGKLVASEQGVLYAPLYYKKLETERNEALTRHRGNFDVYITLSSNSNCKECLTWWIKNIKSTCRPIEMSKPDIVIESDSSRSGWGGFDRTNNVSVSGQWTEKDKSKHINFLELQAAFYSLQFLCQDSSNVHVQLFLDNTVAIKYLSKMGGRKPDLNDLTFNLWLWCAERNIWLSVFHIPGKENVVADKLSRKTSDDMEWALTPACFGKIQEKMCINCDIDMFASRTNKKLDHYVSYIPDKQALAINALLLHWSAFTCIYMFPPFSLLGAVLQKVNTDKAEAILMAPIFPTQVWFPRLLNMVCQQPYILPETKSVLYNPKHPEKTHSLEKMRLGSFRISSKDSLVKEYQKKLQISSCHLGNPQHQNSISRIAKNGCSFVVKGKLINLIPI